MAKENHLRTIAFPCISTGIYGYPQRPAAKVALSTVKKFLLDNKDAVRHIYSTNCYFTNKSTHQIFIIIFQVDRIIFCLFLETDKDIYEELLQKYFAVN